MVEEKVERVVFTAHFQGDLPSDKGEAGAQLQKESLDVVHKCLLHFGLAARVRGAEEIEEIGVFEKLGGHVGVRRGHGEGKIVLGFARP